MKNKRMEHNYYSLVLNYRMNVLCLYFSNTKKSHLSFQNRHFSFALIRESDTETKYMRSILQVYQISSANVRKALRLHSNTDTSKVPPSVWGCSSIDFYHLD